MNPTEPQPGHSVLCQGCACFNAWLHDQGHPNPCRQVRWEGYRHLEPTLTGTGDGESCDGYQTVAETEMG